MRTFFLGSHIVASVVGMYLTAAIWNSEEAQAVLGVNPETGWVFLILIMVQFAQGVYGLLSLMMDHND